MLARGGDLTAKSISSVGGLIEYLCSGVETFDLFILLLLLEWCICTSHTMFSDNEKSSCLLKSSLRNSSERT